LVLVVDATTGEEKYRLLGDAEGIAAVAYSHDDTRIATASDQGSVQLWDAATGELLGRLGVANEATRLVFSTDDRKLIWSGYRVVGNAGHSCLTVCDIADGVGRRRPVTVDVDGPIQLLASSSDSRRIWIWYGGASATAFVDLITKKTSVYCPGWADLNVLAKGLPETRWATVRNKNRNSEFAVIDLRTKKEVAWFPRPLCPYRVFPDGRRWVVGTGRMHPEIVQLEGELE
jgi:WD40 repeat protein